MTERRKVFFTMVDHPLQGPIRVGNAYPTKGNAKGWLPFVRGAWRGCRTFVSTCTLTLVDGALSARSVALLDRKYNLDALPASLIPPGAP